MKRLRLSNNRFHNILEHIVKLTRLEELGLRGSFNDQIKFLPQTLKVLDLGIHFDKSIDFINDLKLIELHLHHFYYDKEIKSLPITLKKLTIMSSSKDYSNLITDLKSLEILKINGNFNSYIISTFPPSLKKLILSCSNTNTNTISELKINLPNLEQLELFGNINQYIISFPSSLKKLNLGIRFDQSLNLTNLTNLTNLEELRLSTKFNQPIDNELPLSLKVLTIDKGFKQSTEFIANMINLEHLVLHKQFDQNINKLPPSLKRITLYSNQLELITCPLENIKTKIYKF